MSKFLTTSQITAEIETIIIDAEERLVLVSPYIKISELFIERLRTTTEKDIEIIIIYGKKDLSESEEEKLSEFSTINFFYCENLHAKCYFNESRMVVTSMNLYEYSMLNNREMGVLITKQDDFNVYSEAVKETESIIENSLEDHFNIEKPNFFSLVFSIFKFLFKIVKSIFKFIFSIINYFTKRRN